MSVPAQGRIDEREGRVAEGFAALGFGCDVWTDPPGQVWADFVHDVDEIVMLIEGEIEVSFRGEDAPPRAGRGDRDPDEREAHRQNHPGPIDKIATNRWYYLRLPPGIADA